MNPNNRSIGRRGLLKLAGSGAAIALFAPYIARPASAATTLRIAVPDPSALQ